MEHDKKALTEEAQATLKKQKAMIEKLQKENEEMRE
jgi:hypothetical protein